MASARAAGGVVEALAKLPEPANLVGHFGVVHNLVVVQTRGCGYGRGMAVVEDDLSLVFSALADPTRRAILERLARGDATVNQLAEPFAMTQQAVSKHLKVLEHARLIS
ncbi:MAG: ArsR family transcriptional regulator, partial [Actinomycetia bacterium]|nr:ArsR family transcriptional regulator [Actinomycetes bacterium]